MSSASRRAIQNWRRRSPRRRTPTGRPPRAARYVTRSRWRCCASPDEQRLTPSAVWPAAGRGWCRWPANRGPSHSSPRRTPWTAARRSTRTTGTRTGCKRSPPARPSASGCTGPAAMRPGCGARRGRAGLPAPAPAARGSCCRRPAVAGHGTEQAGHHVGRGHAQPLDDGYGRGVPLVDLCPHLGQAERPEGMLDHGAGGLGGVPLAPEARGPGCRRSPARGPPAGAARPCRSDRSRPVRE
jgi:hypothetical protein